MRDNECNQMYMDIAERISKMSYGRRGKVAAVIVKDGSNIVSFGYNGTPAGFDNNLEDEVTDQTTGETKLVTKPEVIHSEINAICKAAKQGISTDGASIYVTLSPCYDCAKAIIQAGIKRVFYREVYRNTAPLEMLEKAGVKCINLPKTED